MTWPITSSRSASVLVSDDVLASRLCTVPPCPCRTWMISKDSWLTCCGSSAAKSGLNPLNSVVRFSGGRVRSTGIVPPGGRVSPVGPVPSASDRNRWPMRFL